MMKTISILAVVGLLLAASAEAAIASRPARPAERTKIVRVIRTYVDTSDCCAVISRLKLSGISVSTADPRWAVVGVHAWDEEGTDIGWSAAVLHRGFITGKWSVRAFGTAHLGCDVPARVQRDLRLECS